MLLSLLLLAATDTTSASITRVVQLLAENPKVQETLRREILDATTHVGRTLFDLDYDAFAKLPYLEAVVRESLRMCVCFRASPTKCSPSVQVPRILYGEPRVRDS